MMNQVGTMPEKPTRRTSTSAPPILATQEDIKHGETAHTKTSLNKIALEEILDKWTMRPYSDTWQSPRSINCEAKKKRSEVSQLIQCGWKREKMWLSDVFNTVGPLSKAMELEKNIQKQSIGSSSSLLGLSPSNQQKNAWLLKNNKGKIYQDWRGIIVSETTAPYTMLNKKDHEERLRNITRRQRSKVMHFQNSKLERPQRESKQQGKMPYRKKDAITLVHEKVKRIGPHLEIFEAFAQARKAPTKDKMVSAAICIQKLIRGWLDRCRLTRLRIKAKNHGPTLLAVVREYRKMMARIKRRCGILDLSTPLIFEQFEDWLNQKHFYETMFAKREYLKEMDQNELPKFFRDCGRFPSPDEMNNTIKLVLEGSDLKLVNISKTQAVEMAFMLYPPRGLKLITAAAARSTWLKPIVDGEDAATYLMHGHPALKTDVRVAGALVATSIRERKKKECEIEKITISS